VHGIDAVVVVIHGEGGRILGVSRPGQPEDVGLPGGSIDPGETAEAAAIREVKEETSLDVAVRHHSTHEYHGHRLHVFVATAARGTPRSSPEGEVSWVTWDAVGRGRHGAFNRALAVNFTAAS
jgi:8-oxo-dGTP pyrophosphatase MutT (NUDIX family)